MQYDFKISHAKNILKESCASYVHMLFMDDLQNINQ